MTTYLEMMTGGPSFEIPVRPERTFPFRGGVEYEGSTTFVLCPEADPAEPLTALVERVLTDGPYRYGDFLNLPMPLYLVKDTGTGDVFRVSVRGGTVRLHVLPATEPPGLRALYDRLVDRTGVAWAVECRTD
ncbi:MAG: hypothetical protein ACI9K3_001248 [Halovenus sp.]|jgi:hypothetical protein